MGLFTVTIKGKHDASEFSSIEIGGERVVTGRVFGGFSDETMLTVMCDSEEELEYIKNVMLKMGIEIVESKRRQIRDI